MSASRSWRRWGWRRRDSSRSRPSWPAGARSGTRAGRSPTSWRSRRRCRRCGPRAGSGRLSRTWPSGCRSSWPRAPARLPAARRPSRRCSRPLAGRCTSRGTSATIVVKRLGHLLVFGPQGRRHLGSALRRVARLRVERVLRPLLGVHAPADMSFLLRVEWRDGKLTIVEGSGPGETVPLERDRAGQLRGRSGVPAVGRAGRLPAPR
jgi:hypothetical protein